jgi:hypothetical protein
MQTKIDVKKEVMTFTNNVLSAVADGKHPTQYLTSNMHQTWWTSVEECQKTVKIYVNEDYKAHIDLNKFARIGHPHNGFKDFFKSVDGFIESFSRKTITENQLNQLTNMNYFAPEGNQVSGREYTKFRVIVSEVPMINQDGTVTKMKVITTCAPNLMGTSAMDMKLVDKSTGKVNQEAYKKTCDEIAGLIAYAAKENGIHPLKISEFGLGVYIQKLSESEKNVARSIMYKAFAEAATKYEVQIDWLIWSKNRDVDSSVKNLNDTHFKNYTFIHAESGDLIADVQKWKDKDTNVAELNNGSDRTIGGHLTMINPTTTEEQLGQASLLVFVQTNTHDYFLNNVNYIQLNTNNKMHSQTSLNTLPPIHIHTNASIMNHPQTKVNLNDYRIANRKKQDNKIEFSYKTKEQEQALATLLKNHEIQVETFNFNGFERVVFDEKDGMKVKQLITNAEKPIVQPINNTNSPKENSTSIKTSNSQDAFFNSQNSIALPSDQVRLFEHNRVTTKQLPCYEISCLTKQQNTTILYGLGLDDNKVQILETMFFNNSYRIKIAPTSEALAYAKSIVANMNMMENKHASGMSNNNY